MRKKTAIISMLSILCVLALLHIFVLTGVIHYDKVWAGKISSVEEMQRLESFALGFTLFMMAIISIKYRLLKAGKDNTIINLLIWGFCGFFVLNTVTNLFAQSMIELVLGVITTATSTVLCFFIAKPN